MTKCTSLLLPDAPFAVAELSAARLDGHVVPLATGFLPPDAPAPPRVRAAAIAPLLPRGYAFVLLTAAWVHGVTSTLTPPLHVQRCAVRAARRPQSHQLRTHDGCAPPSDLQIFAGARVTTPERTLADLAR
ncbi:MAG: hypothetical protein QM607_07465, partial [Microbacterium sp.]